MQNNTALEYQNRHKGPFCGVCWSAVFAGVIIALSAETLFNLLGIGLGFSAYFSDSNTLSELGFGSSLWLAVTGVISMFTGGWTAGRFARFNKQKLNGVWHGLLSWSVSTLVLFILISTASSTFIAAGVGTLYSEQLSLPALQKTLAQSNNQNLSGALPAVNNAQINSQINTGNQLSNEQLKQKIEDTSKALSALAFVTFVAFLLSAIAGAAGGYIGSNQHRLRDTAAESQQLN